MSWLRIDDGFVEHPKVLDLSDRAFRLHMAGLCYCARNLTDGRLPVRAVKAVCAITSSQRRHVVELRDAGLWLEDEDGWEIKDYLRYNPDAVSAKAVKDARSEAGKRGADKRWHGNSNDNTDSNGDGKRDGNGYSKAHMPRPVPGPTPKDPNPTEPVADIGKRLDQLQAAARLYEAIPAADRDEGTERIVLSYANLVSVEELDAIRLALVRKLDGDALFKTAGAYVNGALQKAARKPRAAA